MDLTLERTSGFVPEAIPFAHPVPGDPHVDLPLALTGGACALLLVVVALAAPRRRTSHARPAGAVTSWEGQLSRAQVATRSLAVVLLLLAIATGRLGVDAELDNLAPALMIGAAPAALAAAALLVGPVWRWLDPWDAVARLFAGPDRSEASGTVWPAVVVVLPMLWYFSVFLDAFSPRAVGAMLAIYTIATVAGCVAFGRARWLSSAEPIGITLSWVGLLPRGRLADWDPPRGGEALLGVLSGGFLFGLVRRTEVWTELTTGMNLTRFTVYASVGLVIACGVLAGLLVLMGKVADLVGTRPGVARAAVPVVAGIILAVSLARDRLFVSAQLLPGLIGDPFGQGWDLLGPALDGLDPAPLSAAHLLTLQIAILVLTALVGAVVAVARVPDRLRRLPIAITVGYLSALSVVAVAMH